MLILKRRIGQSFLIDGRILVKLMSTARGSAVIGIQAPVALPVLRKEVLDRPKDEPTICPGCKQEIDPDTCWCGDLMKGHSYDGHSPVPMGCDCGRMTQNILSKPPWKEAP